MGVRKLLNNFSGGEISPQLDARTDLQKYGTSCRTLDNFRPLPWGGALFRSGTLFVAAAKYDDRPCRLMPFNYSTSVTYVIEMGDLYMRFFTGAGVRVDVTSGTATPWVNVAAYTSGQYTQWMGVVYRCILNVAAVLPPPYNASPDIDPTHWTAQSAYELVSPYTAAEVFEVQFKEINDVVYLVHPSHPPYKLTRTSAVTFTLAEVSWRYPALLDENVDGTTGLALSATTGTGVVMTANLAMFSPLHVGSYWELRHLAGSTSTELDISGANASSAGIEVVGDWTLTTRETWNGTLQIQRSQDGGSTFQVYREFKSSSNHNVSVSGSELPPAAGRPRVQLKLVFTGTAGSAFGTPPWVGTPPNTYVLASAFLELADAYVAALVKVTAYTDSTHAVVTVVNKAASTTQTTTFSEGAWSAYRGYPRAIGLYEQRVLFAGTTFKPNTVWGSVSADFENFLFSDLDDAAIAYQPATCEQNPTQWIETLDRAFMGTSGEEMALASGNDNEALTPSNAVMRGQSEHGSAYMQPLKVGKAILFLERQTRRLRELMEGNPLIEKGGPDPIDLTLLAEHITDPGIVQMAFGKVPDQQVYCVRSDGRMCVMTYNKEQNINAWARWVTQGSFLSVATVHGTPSDVTFVVTERNLGSGPKRYIEVFTAESTDPVAGINGMDCAIYQTQAASRTVANLSALEGIRVAVVADGYVVGDAYTGVGALTVSGGQITLPADVFPDGATRVRVGVPYFGILKPMKIDMDLASGPTQGQRRRLTNITVRFLNSMGCNYGNATSNDPLANPQQFMQEVISRMESDNMDEPVPLFSGDKQLPMEQGVDVSADIVVSQLKPLPCTILGIFGELDYFGT